MLNVSTPEELKQAMKQGEVEILVTDPAMARRIQTWFIIRKTANIAVFVILALAIFAWANPLNLEFLATPGFRLARQIALGVGVLLLFAEYAMPVVRSYNVTGRDESGLRLKNRKSK